jgi:transposase
VERGMMILAEDLEGQIQPVTFEHALCHPIDHELDLSRLRGRYKNDLRGAPAYDPAVLLKIVLLAYSCGMISSRRIAYTCDQTVMCMAVSGDSHPDFTLIARFVAELGDEVARLFQEVLLVCTRMGLIGKELLAIDGVKLPSNASKSRSCQATPIFTRYDDIQIYAPPGRIGLVVGGRSV